MPRGFDVTGSFFTKVAQTVVQEAPVLFDTAVNVRGLCWNPALNPQQVQIEQDGVYKMCCVVNNGTPGQLAFAVNGVVLPQTIQGSNHGAAQITIRVLVELKKGDIVTVINHTSVAPIQLTAMAGGLQNTVSAELVIFKIAQLCKPCVDKVDCDVEKYYECYYEQYRNYLLCKEHLQIAGSHAFLSLAGTVLETTNQNDAFNWGTNENVRHVDHVQGRYIFTICKSGLYDIFGDVLAKQAQQISLFVNGLPQQTTIYGRDSGAGRLIQRQFIRLCAGDKVSVNNYQSGVGPVTLPENPGGQEVGPNKQFLLFMLNPLNDDKSDKSDKSSKSSRSHRSNRSGDNKHKRRGDKKCHMDKKCEEKVEVVEIKVEEKREKRDRRNC